MAGLPPLPPSSPLPSPPYSSDEESNPASSNDRSTHSSRDDCSSSPYECDWGNFLGRGPPFKNPIKLASSSVTDTGTHEETSDLEEDDGKSTVRKGSSNDDNTIEEEVDARVFFDKEAAGSFDYKHMESPSYEVAALDVSSGTKDDPIYIFSDPEEDKSSPSSSSLHSSSLSNDFPKTKRHRLG